MTEPNVCKKVTFRVTMEVFEDGHPIMHSTKSVHGEGGWSHSLDGSACDRAVCAVYAETIGIGFGKPRLVYQKRKAPRKRKS